MPITLNSVKGASYYCSGRLSIGVYVKDNKAILIDSGIDQETAKMVDKALAQKGCQITAIINTHSHADHCGGNAFLQNKYKDLQIFSTKSESVFIDNPALEPTCFCAGADPFLELRNKYLEAKPSAVTNLIHPYKDQSIVINGETFQIITLPGHTPGMIGVITPDNIFYCGDALFGEETFSKHGILFYTNIADTLATFDKLAALPVDALVFYHGGLAENNLKSIALDHKKRITDTYNFILDAIFLNRKGYSLETLTQQIMDIYKISKNVMQITLTQTCVNAYITQLQKDKKITLSGDDGVICISAVNNKINRNPIITSRFGQFKLEDNQDEVVISVDYLSEVRLKGEMHMDAHILNALTQCLNHLKTKQLIHADTIINADQPYASVYTGILSSKDNNVSLQAPPARVTLFEDHFQISFKKEDAVSTDKLVAEMESLGLKLSMHYSHSRGRQNQC